MEKIYTVVTRRWGHEVVAAQGMKQPTPEDFIETTASDGSTVNVLRPDFVPEIEQVELEAVVVVDEEDKTMFKFLFDKPSLANFLANYVEHLDTDGRKLLRDALQETGGVVIPEIEVKGLKLIPGGKQ